MSTKEQIKEVVDELQALPFGESIKTPVLDCADGTVRAYLSDMSAADESYIATPNGDGAHTIVRQPRKVWQGSIDKPELQNKLFRLKHGQIFSCHRTDLAMSMARANALVSQFSGDGINTTAYLRAVIGDKLFVVALLPSAEKKTDDEGDRELLDELQPKPQPTPTPPKPESPTTWLERQLCRLFLDELEGKLTFKTSSADQRIQYKALARDYQVNPYKFGGMDFSITYDYGKESLIVNRKSIRRGKWHRDSVVGRSSVRRGKVYAHWFDFVQLPSEMLHSVRRNRGLLNTAQDLWFEIIKVDGEIGCTVKMNHGHGAPKTETQGSRLERDTWEAAQIMRMQPEVQVFPIWWAAADVEPLLAEHGLESLKVKEIYTPDREHDFSLIYR